MLNHVKKGLERTYDCYELEEEKRASFMAWEQEIAAIARKAGVAAELLLPDCSDVPKQPQAGVGYAKDRELPSRPLRAPHWQQAPRVRAVARPQKRAVIPTRVMT
jgi:hypothetical protein